MRQSNCLPTRRTSSATQERLLVDGNLQNSLNILGARMLFQEMNLWDVGPFQEAVVSASGPEVYLALSSSSTCCSSSASTHRSARGARRKAHHLVLLRTPEHLLHVLLVDSDVCRSSMPDSSAKLRPTHRTSGAFSCASRKSSLEGRPSSIAATTSPAICSATRRASRT